jgi:hypothetical protein
MNFFGGIRTARINLFSRASVVVEAPFEIPFVMHIIMSSPAGAPLNGMWADGSGIIGTVAVVGTLTALSFDNFAEEAAARAIINADSRGPKAMMLTDDKLSPPNRSG